MKKMQKIINGFGKILFQVKDMSKQEIWTETKTRILGYTKVWKICKLKH